MVRQFQVMSSSDRPFHRGRGSIRGRGRIGFAARGGILKPPPLMARPMPPPIGIRRPPLLSPYGPPPRMDFRRMAPRFPGPGIPRGMPGMRGRLPFAPTMRGRGMRPPLIRGGMIPRGRGGLFPPPFPGPAVPGMFRPPGPLLGPPMMRGRGQFRGRGRGPSIVLNRKSGKPAGGKVPKKPSNSPTSELNKPWVTEAMKNEILKKHKLHQKIKTARTDEDWESVKEHRNKLTTMLREAKLEYLGAHPEEDVDNILAEAGNTVSDKDETKATATSEGNDTALKLEEGPEPMEEEEGGANEGMELLLKCDDESEPPQDPEVEMKSESVAETEQTEHH